MIPQPPSTAGTMLRPALRPAWFGRHVVVTLVLTILATAGLIAAATALRGGDSGYVTPAWAVWFHLATVIPAVPLGAWVLWGAKGTPGHRRAGRIWVALMLATSADSFFIRSITGGLSPIHVFSVLTLVSLPLAIIHARAGRIAAHRRAMVGPYIGLIVAGIFAFLPGRLLGMAVGL